MLFQEKSTFVPNFTKYILSHDTTIVNRDFAFSVQNYRNFARGFRGGVFLPETPEKTEESQKNGRIKIF